MAVIDRTGCRDDHAVGGIMAAHISRDRIARHRADDIALAQHGPSHRLIRVGDGLELVKDDIIGRVQRLTDLLQDHGALSFKLGRVEARMLQDIGQDIDAERDIFLKNLGVIGGILPRGIGVEMTADILDRLGNRAGVAALGTLEGHVFKQMGNAVQRLWLVAGADIDPNAKGDGIHRRHVVGNDLQAIVEAGNLRTHVVSVPWIKRLCGRAPRRRHARHRDHWAGD